MSGMMKKLKRRLSWTIKGARPLDGSLSELAEHLTIDDTSNSNDTFLGRPMSVPLQHNGECSRPFLLSLWLLLSLFSRKIRSLADSFV